MRVQRYRIMQHGGEYWIQSKGLFGWFDCDTYCLDEYAGDFTRYYESCLDATIAPNKIVKSHKKPTVIAEVTAYIDN